MTDRDKKVKCILIQKQVWNMEIKGCMVGMIPSGFEDAGASEINEGFPHTYLGILWMY